MLWRTDTNVQMKVIIGLKLIVQTVKKATSRCIRPGHSLRSAQLNQLPAQGVKNRASRATRRTAKRSRRNKALVKKDLETCDPNRQSQSPDLTFNAVATSCSLQLLISRYSSK